MSKSILKRSRLLIVVAVVLMGLLLVAGTGLAYAPQTFKIYGGDNPVTGDPTDYVKAAHTYDYRVEVLNFSPAPNLDEFCENYIYVSFPKAFDLSELDGQPVHVEIELVDGTKHYLNSIVSVGGKCGANYKWARFEIQRSSIAANGNVRNLIINGLKVMNPAQHGVYNAKITQGAYTGTWLIDGFFDTALYEDDWKYNNLTLNVVKTVGSIEITEIIQGGIVYEPLYEEGRIELTKGNNFTVKGEVRDTTGELWTESSYPVIIEIRDCKGNIVYDPNFGSKVYDPCNPHYLLYTNPCDSTVPIGPYLLTNANNGHFSAQVMMTGCYATDGVGVKAYTLETPDHGNNGLGDPGINYNGPYVNANNVPAEALEDFAGAVWEPKGGNHHLWGPFGPANHDHNYLSTPKIKVHKTAGTPFNILQTAPGRDFSIQFNKPTPVTVVVVDKFGNPTTTHQEPIKVELYAYVAGDPSTPAGKFYSGDNEITYTHIPAGASSVTVSFTPNKTGPIVIEEKAMLLGTIKQAWCCGVVTQTSDLELEPKALVTDDAGNPVAGWPIRVALWLDEAATEDFSVKVKLNDGANLAPWARWDGHTNGDNYLVCDEYAYGEQIVRGFNVAGKYAGDDTQCWWDTSTHPWCNPKTYIYIYPNATKPQACTSNPWGGAVGRTLTVTVELTGSVTGRVITDSFEIGPFASPDELKRVLDSNTWQILSTPKYLAPWGVEYNGGNGGTFAELLDAGSYAVILEYDEGCWGVVTPNSTVEPLKAYYVRTKQKSSPGFGNWYAHYVFARATNPADTIPPMLGLDRNDWNTIGVSVNGNIQDTLFNQSEKTERAIGTLLGQNATMVWNPGTHLANLASFNTINVTQGTFGGWTGDTNALMYNGDGYWLYPAGGNHFPQPYAANVGLDLIP